MLKALQKSFEFKSIFGQTAEEVVNNVDLSNKTCLITGASSGIGLEIARCLNSRDCNLLMASRNVYKANLLANKTCLNNQRIRHYQINLASLASVRQCAQEIIENERQIDIVILNAATFGIPWTVTKDGLETTFQVNFLSQYYLLLCLGKMLAPDARVVFTSSESHRNIKWPEKNRFNPVFENLSLLKHEYTSIKSYNISKLCCLLLMHYLSYQWSNSERSFLCAHPGSFIKTGLCRNWWPYEALYTIMLPFSKSIMQGASTILYCATSPNLKGATGMYFSNCNHCNESDLAKDIYFSFRIHDLILDILRDRVQDLDKLTKELRVNK
ncbi:WW domain-containing oxidoreductase [Danaus plexippus plexippus]|uniref:WW domain-containing oxidoreductase n=1 Tax=Danaus plexippus plexippus TaxID=278856 RepID=A0A212EKM0_DANPL|nr:WW domain-containing oxidoreductase [Danaus plexippus plexippus]